MVLAPDRSFTGTPVQCMEQSRIVHSARLWSVLYLSRSKGEIDQVSASTVDDQSQCVLHAATGTC